MKGISSIFLTVIILSQIANAQLESYQDIISFRDLTQEGDGTFTILDSAALDSFIIATMDQYHIPGVSACIVREGEVYWTGVYGYSNIEQNLPVTDSTTFTVGSISKPFTATALMQLWEEGLFGLDDNINNHLPPELQIINPSFPDESITFRQLLTHKSSIDNDAGIWLSLTSPGSDSPISLYDYLVNYFMPGGSYYNWGPFNNWAPGAQWEYSNEAFALAGYLVEAIADTPFAEYCQENIFTPLDMHETSWFLDGLDTSKIAVGYSYNNNNNYVPYEHSGFPVYPASDLRTSAPQLARFLLTVMQRGEIDGIRILDSTTVDSMTTVQCPTTYSFLHQGLAWRVSNNTFPALGVKTYISHPGAMPGYRAGLIYLLDCENPVGAIVLTNGESTDGLIAIWEQLTTFGYFNQRIYAQNTELSSSFMQPGVDTLIITTQFNNTDNHSFSANALISTIDSSIINTTQLFDDGNHGDGSLGDGLWGGFITPISSEDRFTISVSADDFDADVNMTLDNLAHFTTTGPVVFNSLEQLYPNNGVIQPGMPVYFDLYLENLGSIATVENISVYIQPADTNTTLGDGYSSTTIGDIPAGEVLAGLNYLALQPVADLDDGTPIRFNVEISSNGVTYWEDQGLLLGYVGIDDEESVLPTVFRLKQNHPNPFNPTTTISYSLPEQSPVNLTVFDIQGREVIGLLNTEKPPGNYDVHWNGLNQHGNQVSTGVYFARLEAGSYSKTIKMVYLR
jgi:CubicO group peptidase (beta-lactamase class C family)